MCVWVAFLAVNAAGQAPVRDYAYAREENPLLGFDNPAAFSSFGQGHISYAALSFQKDNGALVSINGSDNSWEAYTRTESFWRLSDKLVLSGSLDYSYFSGQNMGGVILLDPAFNPVQFLEAAPGEPGLKIRENYHLCGGISYSCHSAWSLGLRVDYTSSDRNKRKDPRFQNLWMDIAVEPGFYFSPSERFGIGANLIYRHTLEQIKGKTYGTIDKDYKIWIDQGGFLGSYEDFVGDAGYLSVSNVRPMSNHFYGLALQVSSAHFFNQLTGLWRNGFYGTRSSSTVVFCEFSGPEASWNSVLTLPGSDSRHIVSLDATYRSLDNFTNSYSYQKEEGMPTQVVYTAQTKTCSRTELEASLGYRFRQGLKGFLPEWAVSAHVDGSFRKGQTVIYPRYRNTSLYQIYAQVDAEKNFNLPFGSFTLGLDADFLYGGGVPKEDGMMIPATDRLISFDYYLDRQFEYDTASRAGVGLRFGFSWRVSDKLVPYVFLSDHYTTLLAAPVSLSGRFVNRAQLSLGIHF